MKILKVAKSGNEHFTQYHLVFDEIPKVTYEKFGVHYVGSATLPSGEVVFSRYLEHHSWPGAFAGNTLRLEMKDGSIEEIKDYWYDSGNFPAHGEFCQIGAETVANLQRCYVYCGMYISRAALQELLNEYYAVDRDYTYEEVRDWINMQYIWYPVVIDGKHTQLMVNERGDFVDRYTKKRVHVQRNIYIVKHKQKGRTDKCFSLCLFEWKHMDEGRLIKVCRKMIDVLRDSLPEELYRKRTEDLRSKCLI